MVTTAMVTVTVNFKVGFPFVLWWLNASYPATIADGYPQMWRIGTSTSPMPVPRPLLELSMNLTPLLPPLPSPSLNYTIIV
jgi:hypothetical protein